MNFSSLSRIYKRLSYLRHLKKQQWLDENHLDEIQEQKLRKLVNHAYRNVPYYKNLFDSYGISPNEIKKKTDLQKIPILTKDNIRNNFPNNIVDKNANPAHFSIRSTTGSTGIPLKIILSPDIELYRTALFFFVFFQWGLRLNDKLLSLRHSPFFSNNSIFEKIGILNWKNLSVFNPIESNAKYIMRNKPDVISTYPSVHLILLEEFEKHNINEINPRFVTAHGETLTDRNRERLMQRYNSDVYTQYSTVETGSIAFECKQHTGLHIISDAAIIETVNGNQNAAIGEEGEIVVTCLYNHTMPLIRYKLGDIGILTDKKCPCGRGYQLIKNIVGRTDDFLILPSGRKISPRVINVIENIPGVSSYKTVQEAKNKIVVNLKKGKGFNQTTINEIKNHIKNGCLGEDVKVEVKLVKELPRNSRGKLRTVISNVKE